MGEIIEFNNNDNNVEAPNKETNLIEISEGILLDTRTDITTSNTISVPITQLSTLGSGVASLLPALRTVTQSTTASTQGLYRLANTSVGDVLKVAKNGNYWGAFKTPSGASKLLQLKDAGPLATASKTVMPINPATMMMAVALFSIEQQLGSIEEMGKQIISFLETEKEAEIEADVETLVNLIAKYKSNWDNEYFVASNHKLVLDIQRTARKNMLSYQKSISDKLHSKKRIIIQEDVNSTLHKMKKGFKYYRLSLYSYALASFIEIMLSGNFKEENIAGNIEDVKTQSFAYRDLFEMGSAYLERLSKHSVETNVLKGVGTASKAVGKLIENTPVIRKGPVDEFLQGSGYHLNKNAHRMKQSVLTSFASISNPGTGVFIDKMNDMIQIYNHTTEICFDENKIYLIAG